MESDMIKNRLESLKKELERKKQKLEKSHRLQRARDHVRQKIKEQVCLSPSENSSGSLSTSLTSTGNIICSKERLCAKQDGRKSCVSFMLSPKCELIQMDKLSDKDVETSESKIVVSPPMILNVPTGIEEDRVTAERTIINPDRHLSQMTEDLQNENIISNNDGIKLETDQISQNLNGLNGKQKQLERPVNVLMTLEAQSNTLVTPEGKDSRLATLEIRENMQATPEREENMIASSKRKVNRLTTPKGRQSQQNRLSTPAEDNTQCGNIELPMNSSTCSVETNNVETDKLDPPSSVQQTTSVETLDADSQSTAFLELSYSELLVEHVSDFHSNPMPEMNKCVLDSSKNSQKVSVDNVARLQNSEANSCVSALLDSLTFNANEIIKQNIKTISDNNLKSCDDDDDDDDDMYSRVKSRRCKLNGSVSSELQLQHNRKRKTNQKENVSSDPDISNNSLSLKESSGSMQSSVSISCSRGRVRRKPRADILRHTIATVMSSLVECDRVSTENFDLPDFDFGELKQKKFENDTEDSSVGLTKPSADEQFSSEFSENLIVESNKPEMCRDISRNTSIESPTIVNILDSFPTESANVSEVISIEHTFLSTDDTEEIILCSFKKQIIVYKKNIERPEWGELFSWMPGDEQTTVTSARILRVKCPCTILLTTITKDSRSACLLIHKENQKCDLTNIHRLELVGLDHLTLVLSGELFCLGFPKQGAENEFEVVLYAFDGQTSEVVRMSGKMSHPLSHLVKIIDEKIICGISDSEMMIWHLGTGSLLQKIVISHKITWCSHILHENGLLFLPCTMSDVDGCVRVVVINPLSAKSVIVNLQNTPKTYREQRFILMNRCIFCACYDDGTLLVWSLHTGSLLMTADNYLVRAASLHPKNNILTVITSNGHVKILNFSKLVQFSEYIDNY